MFNINSVRNDTKNNMYEDLIQFADGLFYEEQDAIANMSNLASLLFNILPDVNWAGFYLYKDNQLVLGPFNGKPACIRIALGKGVCGTAADTLETQLVRDVHTYPGHIACDGDTNSEIVIPMVMDSQLIGVLDLDSPVKARFDEIDKQALEKIVNKLLEACDWKEN